jgi:hypothetical protein
MLCDHSFAPLLKSYIIYVVQFRWVKWNEEHAAGHGCSIPEIESVVRQAGRGYPRRCGPGKLLVVGRGQGGRPVKVIYVLDDDGTAFVIHAMPMTTGWRRRRG